MNRMSTSVSNAIQILVLTGLFCSPVLSAQSSRTRDRTPPTAPTKRTLAAPTKPMVTLIDLGPTHASLNWSSTDDGPFIWYSIFIDGEPVATLNSKTATFTCAAVLVPTGCIPLDQETTYTFTVRAGDVDGNWSPVSDPVVVTTQPANPNDQTPPTQPANVSAESDGAHINVRWDPSTDDFAPQSLIRYDVYVNGESRAVVVGQTTAQIENEYGVVHNIAVIAVDTADNQSAAGTVIVCTGSGPSAW